MGGGVHLKRERERDADTDEKHSRARDARRFGFAL
jgi:hypothetical protein